MAEHVYNSATSESSEVSLLYTNYGYQPQTSWPAPKHKWDNLDPTSEIRDTQWKETWEEMRTNLIKARERQQKWYDKRHEQAPEFEEGSQILLDRRNIRTKRPSIKLHHKKFGPFKVLEKVDLSSYRLNLLAQWKIHSVFHIRLLEHYREPQDPTRRLIPPPPEMEEEEESWVVKEVVDSRTMGRKNKIQYRVLWEGYRNEAGTWEL